MCAIFRTLSAKKYDYIPLHTDEEYAKKTMFGNLIAPGVMSFMAVWAKYLETNLAGDQLLAGKSTKIEWKKPVYADDVLNAICTVSKLIKRNEKMVWLNLHLRSSIRKGSLFLQMLPK